jgi:uncharacterized membrane protein YphA (DoxX/SURF4 family)
LAVKATRTIDELLGQGAKDMSFSQTAGVAFVPTMSRIVLALAFITVGYHKLMGQATFTESEERLAHGRPRPLRSPGG